MSWCIVGVAKWRWNGSALSQHAVGMIACVATRHRNVDPAMADH